MIASDWLSIGELVEHYASGTLTAVGVVEATLSRIEATEPHLHAYATVAADQALADAAQADRAAANGRLLGALHGVPIAVKDLVETAGIPTEAGSKVLAGSVPGQDAPVVRRLKEAGAIVVGKSVTHEFAYGRNVVPTRNAWDPDCYSGGSSAGSAVAVAAGTAHGAVGSDTGGSIRAPASMNGIVGLKPTYGSVDLRGVIPLATSLDAVGPMTRTVADASLMLSSMTGRYDHHRPKGDLGGTRLGVAREYFFDDSAEEAVVGSVDQAVAHLSALGAEILQVDIPHLELARTVGQTIMLAEASEWHRDLLMTGGQSYEPGTRQMAQLGFLLPSPVYLKAQKVRSLIRTEVRNAFERHDLDALVGPTIPVTTMSLERWRSSTNSLGETPIASCLRLGMVANVTGQPALSFPVGFDMKGHPIGMQAIGRPFAESTILEVGEAYQMTTDWHTVHPEWLG